MCVAERTFTYKMLTSNYRREITLNNRELWFLFVNALPYSQRFNSSVVLVLSLIILTLDAAL